MSHIIKAQIPVKIVDRACLLRGLGLKGLTYVANKDGYDVTIPGCNQADVTSSLRADKIARIQVRLNNKTGEFELQGESYRIQNQYNDTLNKIVSGYQVAIAEAALRAVYPQVCVIPQANGQMQVMGVSYT